MPHYDFDYDQAFLLHGTLTTIYGAALQARFAQAYPVDTQDDERICTVALHAEGVTISLRHDADVHEDAVIDLVHTAAPDAQGTLILEWPYSELHEYTLPVDLRFQPDQDQVLVFAYEVRSCATPRRAVTLSSPTPGSTTHPLSNAQTSPLDAARRYSEVCPAPDPRRAVTLSSPTSSTNGGRTDAS